MAQVKKFKNPAGPVTDETATTPAGTPAENTEQVKKYGRWIKNGVVYEMDDEKMKELEKHISAMDPNLQIYAAEDFKRLQNGEDVAINTMLNQRAGVDDYRFLNDRQESRLENGKAKEGIFNALFNTKTHKFNKATYELGKWNPEKKPDKKESNEKVEKEKLGMYSGDPFLYELKDDNIQRYKTVLNDSPMLHFDRWANYLEGNDRDKYDISDFENYDALEKWYKSEGYGKEWMDALRESILNGVEVEGEHLDYLKRIGLSQIMGTNDELAQQQADEEASTQQNKNWRTSEYAGVWNGADDQKYFTYNNGEFTFNGGLPQEMGESLGYFFNDEFVEENPEYEYLRGKIFFNNKWYSGQDLLNKESDLYKTLNSSKYDFFNKNKRGEYGEANKVLKASWKNQENLIPAWGPGTEEYLGDFYGNQFLYENLNYNTPGTTIKVEDGINPDGSKRFVYKDIDDDYIIRRGIDLSRSDFLSDGTGRRPWEFVITDAYGNRVTIDGLKDIPLGIDAFKGLYDGTTPIDNQKITPITRISNNFTSDYYNRFADSNNLGFTAYRKPGDDFVHAIVPWKMGGIENQVYSNMPSAVYDAISNKDFINSLLKANSKTRQKVFDLIRNGKRIDNITLAQHLPKNPDGSLNTELANSIISYFKSAKKIDSPESLKKGGVIKAQVGTVVRSVENKTDQKTLDNAQKLNELYTNPYASPTIREDGEWKNLWNVLKEETDPLEAWGLVADGAGMIAGFVPKYGDLLNVALSTVIGNTLYGISDRKKVKAGAAPKGTTWKNLGMSLGADVVSLVPAVGDLTNVANWGRRLTNIMKKSEPFAKAFTTALAAGGFSAALDSVGKLMRGEDLTLDDGKELIFGTMSAMGFLRNAKRATSDSRLAAASAPDAPTRGTKFKNADGVEQSVSLTQEQIDKVTGRGISETKTKENIAEMLRAEGVPDGEVTRIMSNPKALKELGLIREVPQLGPAYYSDSNPQQKDGKYYWFHPMERTYDLQTRTVDQLARGAERDPRAAARWINDNTGYSPVWTRNDVKGADSHESRSGKVVARTYNVDDGTVTISNKGYPKAKYKKNPTTESTESHKKGGVLKAEKGQWFRDLKSGIKSVTEPLVSHDAVQGYLSTARYLLGNASTDRNTERSIKAAEDTARLAQQTTANEIYSPQLINAGDAERTLANQKYKNLPAVTSDSVLNAQMQKTNLDEAANHLANATRLDAKQHYENQHRGVEERRAYAEAANEVANNNRKIAGSLATAKADILNAADTTKTQSLSQYLYQHQAEMDQNRSEALAYKKAIAERKAKANAQQALDEALAEKLGGATFDITNNNHVAIYQALQKQYLTDLSGNLDEELFNTLTPGAQRYVRNNKSGGSLRPAQEQIAINSSKIADQRLANRAKEFDKNWSNSNKEVQKAISKMNDRVHALIMKMLS